MNRKQHGIMLAVVGASLWGTSGTAAEMLYQHANINTLWLVGVRAWLAGAIFLLFSYLREGRKIFAIFHDKHDLLYGALYGLFGLVGSQLTYFYCVQLSNAPTATVLVFLAPVLIIAFMAVKTRQKPRRVDLLSIAVALVGTVILVTNGNLGHLAVTPATLFWGFLSAVTQAADIVMPAKLFKKYGTIDILSWGMLFGGIVLTPVLLAVPAKHVTLPEWGLVLYIVVAGTLLAYALYLSSVLYISAALAGILEAFEPLVATILSVSLLGSDFGIMKMVGGALIVLATGMQLLPSPRGAKLRRKQA